MTANRKHIAHLSFANKLVTLHRQICDLHRHFAHFTPPSCDLYRHIPTFLGNTLEGYLLLFGQYPQIALCSSQTLSQAF